MAYTALLITQMQVGLSLSQYVVLPVRLHVMNKGVSYAISLPITLINQLQSLCAPSNKKASENLHLHNRGNELVQPS